MAELSDESSRSRLPCQVRGFHALPFAGSATHLFAGKSVGVAATGSILSMDAHPKHFAGPFTRRAKTTRIARIIDGLSKQSSSGRSERCVQNMRRIGWAKSNNGNGYYSTLIPINFDTCDFKAEDPCRGPCNRNTEAGFRSSHPEGAHFLMGDGVVRSLMRRSTTLPINGVAQKTTASQFRLTGNGTNYDCNSETSRIQSATRQPLERALLPRNVSTPQLTSSHCHIVVTPSITSVNLSAMSRNTPSTVPELASSNPLCITFVCCTSLYVIA